MATLKKQTSYATVCQDLQFSKITQLQLFFYLSLSAKKCCLEASVKEEILHVIQNFTTHINQQTIAAMNLLIFFCDNQGSKKINWTKRTFKKLNQRKICWITIPKTIVCERKFLVILANQQTDTYSREQRSIINLCLPNNMSEALLGKDETCNHGPRCKLVSLEPRFNHCQCQ